MSAADPLPYFAASAVSAFAGFPLWRASAMGQSGYQLQASSFLGRLWEVARPPWRGSFVVVSGTTCARAAIFFGSDEGARMLRRHGWSPAASTALPPLLISAYVQLATQPFVRSSTMLQGDPQVRFAASSRLPNIAVLSYLFRTRGPGAWWHGAGVGVVRAVPKHVTAIVAKDAMEQLLAPADDAGTASAVVRSAKKSVAAGIVGALLTNPLDVVQNEMFKTHEGVVKTVEQLCRTEGCRWLMRGCQRNVVASAVPTATMIFLTDMFRGWQCNWATAASSSEARMPA